MLLFRYLGKKHILISCKSQWNVDGEIQIKKKMCIRDRRYTDRNESGIDERLRDRMSGCTLCPRMCEADRENGKTGFCGETGEIRAARAALHMWEEPCISGKEGSGTVSYTHLDVYKRQDCPCQLGSHTEDGSSG